VSEGRAARFSLANRAVVGSRIVSAASWQFRSGNLARWALRASPTRPPSNGSAATLLEPGASNRASRRLKRPMGRRPAPNGNNRCVASPSLEPTRGTLKKLYALSGNRCAFQGDRGGCEEVLAKRAWPRVQAEAAHICGENEGAARYDENMTPEDRRAFENLILLCRNHHNEVDYLEPDRYSVEILREWKARHEERAETPDKWALEERVDEDWFAIVLLRTQFGVGDAVNLEGTATERSGASADLSVHAGTAAGGTASAFDAAGASDEVGVRRPGTGVAVGLVNEHDQAGSIRPEAGNSDAKQIEISDSDLVTASDDVSVLLTEDGDALLSENGSPVVLE
jgi:hypothetical protein